MYCSDHMMMDQWGSIVQWNICLQIKEMHNQWVKRLRVKESLNEKDNPLLFTQFFELMLERYILMYIVVTHFRLTRGGEWCMSFLSACAREWARWWGWGCPRWHPSRPRSRHKASPLLSTPLASEQVQLLHQFIFI